MQKTVQAFRIRATAGELAFEILDASVEKRSTDYLPSHTIELISSPMSFRRTRRLTITPRRMSRRGAAGPGVCGRRVCPPLLRFTR
jgi:hypothetical protein